MRSQRVSTLCRLSIVAGATLALALGTAVNAKAQALKDVQTSDTPLVLKAQGSFFIGGEKVEQTQGELGDLGPGTHHRQSDVRAVHGAAGRRWQRARGRRSHPQVDWRACQQAERSKEMTRSASVTSTPERK